MLPSEIDGGHKAKLDVEDLDGTGISQTAMEEKLNPEKSKPVFMNLINIDEKAQVIKCHTL